MNNSIHIAIMLGVSLVVIGGISYYQFVYDPTSYEMMYDCNDPYFAKNLDCTENEYVESMEITTHLKTGLKDYTVHISDGIGSSSP